MENQLEDIKYSVEQPVNFVMVIIAQKDPRTTVVVAKATAKKN